MKKNICGTLKEKVIAALKKRGLDENGREIVDSTPRRIALGLGQAKQEPLHVMVKRMIRENANAFAMENGNETFEEANDFDIDDEFVVQTPYERDFDTQVPDSVMARHVESLAKQLKEQKAQIEQMESELNKKGEKNESAN